MMTGLFVIAMLWGAVGWGLFARLSRATKKRKPPQCKAITGMAFQIPLLGAKGVETVRCELAELHDGPHQHQDGSMNFTHYWNDKP